MLSTPRVAHIAFVLSLVVTIAGCGGSSGDGGAGNGPAPGGGPGGPGMGGQDGGPGTGPDGSVVFPGDGGDAGTPTGDAGVGGGGEGGTLPVYTSSVLAILTAMLPNGKSGDPYQFDAIAGGGTTPYTWLLATGPLPPGLALDPAGHLTGTPTQAGEFPIKLGVSDASNPVQTRSAGFSITIGAPGQAKALAACGVLNVANATYTLSNDVTSTGTCFSVQADGITLDLGGHTVTYATSSPSNRRYGVLAEACWDTEVDGNPCGGSANYLTVRNGSVVQGAGAGAYSHAIRVGQIDSSDHLTVHDVTMTVSSTSSIGIYTEDSGSGAFLYDNTVNNNVTVINNRYEIEGCSMKLEGLGTSAEPVVFQGNTIKGGAQGGLFTDALGSVFFANDVAQAGTYTNDFALYVWGNSAVAYGNTVHPSKGRGISIDGVVNLATGVAVYNNTVTVIEDSDNVEYGGCPLGGTYGIQFDDSPAHSVTYGNTATAVANQCWAQGLRVTDDGSTGPGGNASHDNIFTGQLAAGGIAPRAVGLGIDGEPALFTSTRDTFIGDTSSVYVDWDGATGGLSCNGCTLGKGTNPTNYVTFSFWNGGGAANAMHFLDTTFNSGADKDSTDMVHQDDNHMLAEYFIDWTYTVTVADGSANAVSGATVTVTDALNKHAFTGSTDATGRASTPLTEFRRYNTASAVTKEMHTPFSISISKSGCTTTTYSLALSSTTSEPRTLVCN